MKVLSKGIAAIWKDGSIRRKSRIEFLAEWRAYFACTTTDRFYDLINLDAEPSMVEEYFLVSKVKELWRRSNPLADLENTILRHEQENKPIVKRHETIRIKKIRVKKF